MKNKKVKLITLSLIAVIIVVILSVSLTQAFMKPINDTSSVTEVSLTSCAKISLTDNGSVDLNNSYPMSRNKALQTKPYSFTVNSSCEGYVGFNLYIATLSTNTLDSSKVHYILTIKGSKTTLIEGTLTSDKIVTNEFSEAEKTEYNAGMKGNLSNIYKIYELNLSTETSYDLYLYTDEEAGNETMNKTFKAGVAIKAFDRENTFADYIIAQYSEQGVNRLYHHDADLENGVGDNSYRYAGGDYQLTEKAKSEGYTEVASYVGNYSGITTNLIRFYCDGTTETFVGNSCTTPATAVFKVAGNGNYKTYKEALEAGVTEGYLTKDNIKNYVCFGSNEENCPTDNLYRIIGVFGDKVKLIKADCANSNLLGTDGDYYSSGTYNTTTLYSGYRGYHTEINRYIWNHKSGSNETGYGNVWSNSELNKINLNTNFINNIGENWSPMIAETIYKVGGNTPQNIVNTKIAMVYQNEIIIPNNDIEKEYKAKVGLMYVSDYGYAISQSYWDTTILSKYYPSVGNNWMYDGIWNWTVSRSSASNNYAFYINYQGNFGAGYYVYNNGFAIRPVFYLNSNVKYVSGTGTEVDPYRIK